MFYLLFLILLYQTILNAIRFVAYVYVICNKAAASEQQGESLGGVSTASKNTGVAFVA